MSYTLSPEQLEAVQARDRRFAAIHLGIEVEELLRQGRPLHLLMEKLRTDADAAMKDFAEVNPADISAVIGLQARVFRFQYLFDTLNAILTRGQLAEEAVRGEDMMDREQDERRDIDY